MDFMTRVQVAPLPCPITLRTSLLSLGSCFAQAVGSRLAANCFDITVNPNGTLYNPESVAMAAEGLLMHNAQCTMHNDLADKAQPDCALCIVHCAFLLLTFGTSHVYRQAGVVVANCQKKPAWMFTEDELTVEYIVQRYAELIPRLREKHPDLQVIFTVSPYRYMKYGLHGSALSKARLLLAVDEICSTVEGCHYFPAYEIVTDELRDYRFYDADMVHPNAVAADYVWERFQAACLDDEARRFIKDYAPIRRAMEHRPFNPDSTEHKAFVAKTQQQRNDLLMRYGLSDR